MFSHVMVGSNDIDRAQAFYDALLGVIGAGAGMRDADDQGNVRVFYRHGDSMFCLTKPINGAPATVANGGTIGFNCTSGEQVKQFHDVAVANGGTSCEDPPGVRDTKFGPVHLAYVRDIDGHKLCAMYMGA
ncbi:MAG: VOC family protein [Thauera sp.]|jgi:catechol 2,3-dioxygenase-like lactoylglutathione lyase family enzyme|nr:VOC family protein [Thauera sp.]